MARAQAESLRTVMATEGEALQRLRAARSARVDRVRRATALRAVAQGDRFAQAARRAGFRRARTVAGLVVRGGAHGRTARRSGPGRGRKQRYDTAARAPIVATAPRRPDRKVDGTGTWSRRTLARTLRRETNAGVGATTIRRSLQEAGSASQKTRTWCPTGAAQRKRKAGVVTVTDPETAQKRG